MDTFNPNIRVNDWAALVDHTTGLRERVRVVAVRHEGTTDGKWSTKADVRRAGDVMFYDCPGTWLSMVSK